LNKVRILKGITIPNLSLEKPLTTKLTSWLRTRYGNTSCFKLWNALFWSRTSCRADLQEKFVSGYKNEWVKTKEQGM